MRWPPKYPIGVHGVLYSQSDSRIRLYNASATYVAVKWFFNFDLSRHCNLCRYSIKSRSRMCWDLNIRKPKRLGSSVFKCCNLNTFEISTWLNSEIKYSGEIQWNWIMLPPRHKTPLRYKPMSLTTCLHKKHVHSCRKTSPTKSITPLSLLKGSNIVTNFNSWSTGGYSHEAT